MELSEIKGIGVKRIAALNEVGIFTPSDLLLRFPDKYIFAGDKLDGNIKEGDEISFLGEVIAEAKRSYIRRGLSVVGCAFINNGIKVRCSWFNQPFAARSLKMGDKVYVFGKVKKFKSVIQLTNPTLYMPQPTDGDIIPIYRSAIPSRTFAAAVRTALDNVTVTGYIPREIAIESGILPLQTAITEVHIPSSRAALDAALRSIAIEQLSYVITTYRLLKDDNRDFTYCDRTVVNELVSALPYRMTADQISAVRDIIGAMNDKKLMNMLVQGEVGCGKTAVAMCAMYYAARSGYQAALMAPTEVLARQHYQNLVIMLEPLGVRVQLLCASMNKKQRETAIFNIKYGAASCIVGTQSLLSDGIDFADLRLVIVDEQQRFGVNQRAKLEAKGKKTDMIVMTATPIPRTLALSLYGELQQTDIRSLPANRPKIHTSIVPQYKIKDMYKYVAERAKLDERTYIICPRITDTDDDIMSVDRVYEYIKKTPLRDVTGCVHGKMKDPEKNEVMSDFKSGKIKVLISTTVVEVGIDVPEAAIVVIYDAERFGLSELHQIRGRVGRGTIESYCFLVTENEQKETVERLKNFCAMSDGFSVSELDFKLRGAGDFVGLRQHGNGSLRINEDIIKNARALSDALLRKPDAVKALVGGGSEADFIRSVTMN